MMMLNDIAAKLIAAEQRVALLESDLESVRSQSEYIEATARQALAWPVYKSPRELYYDVYSVTDDATSSGKLLLPSSVERLNRVGFAISSGEVTLPIYGVYRICGRATVEHTGVLTSEDQTVSLAIATNTGGTVFTPPSKTTLSYYIDSLSNEVKISVQTIIVEHILGWRATATGDTDFELIDGKFDLRVSATGINGFKVSSAEIIVQRLGNI
jgi:hypothetical protein